MKQDVVDFDEQELIRKAVDGCKSSANQLLYLHLPALKKHISLQFRGTIKDKTVDDFVHETSVRALRSVTQFRSEGSFLAWLKTIGSRCVIDAIRDNQTPVQPISDPMRSSLRDLIGDISADEETPSGIAASNEMIEAMRLAIGLLKPDRQKAVTLRYLEGKSIEQTAKALSKSIPAVNGILYRARIDLRTHMDHLSKWLSE